MGIKGEMVETLSFAPAIYKHGKSKEIQNDCPREEIVLYFN
jgi:hypothetical protein